MIDKSLIIKATVAGAMIGIAGFAYLAVGGFFGALLFSFGLISIYLYQLKLFTGVSGNVSLGVEGFKYLAVVLLLNIIGAGIVSLAARVSPLGIQDKAMAVVQQRIGCGWWQCGLLAIFCGFIVDEAIYAWNSKKQMLPTIFGVCVFVLCGFCHCVADAFYITALPLDFLSRNIWSILAFYFCVVAGNFLGCNLRRLLHLQG